METKYRARKGSPLTDTQANAVGEELERMEAAGVPIEPHNVVARAQAPEHPLHDLFEWDDGRAAEVRRRNAADFTGWEHDNDKFEAAFEKLVAALNADDTSRRPPPESKL